MKTIWNKAIFVALAICVMWSFGGAKANAADVSGIHSGVQVATDPELEIRASKVVLKKGTSTDLNVDVKKDKKDKNKYKVEWESTNKKVATVSSKGKIKAKKSGTCTITASIAGTNVETSCKVTVKPATGNKIKYGAAYDKVVTVSSLKKNVGSGATVYDNAGNAYTRGECIGKFVITGYCTKCNSGSARATSSGKKATAGVTVAVKSSQIKLGTKLVIGNHVYIAQDRHGNRNHSRVIDVFFGTRHGAEPFLKNIPVYYAK